MSIGTFIRRERGSVSALVALSMTALLGFAGFAMDFGMLAYTKQTLQNAADAAALAGAADLGVGNTSAVNASVNQYCAANGFDPGDSRNDVQVSVSGKTVTVTVSRDVSMGFSAVATGKRQRRAVASATAEAVSIFGGCPYALFAGQRIEDSGTGISVGGNNITINGNIHSNSDITMQHAVLSAGSVATAVRNVSPATSGWHGNSIALDMPSYRSFEKAMSGMQDVVVFRGSKTYKNGGGFQDLIDEAIECYTAQTGSATGYYYEGLYIHITGDLTFNGHNSAVYQAEFPIILAVDGNINLNGAPLSSTLDYPVSILSKSGDITVNGGGERFTGILFAPKGDVILNGNDAVFVGSIVGQNIRKTGGKISVTYYEEADRFLPTSKVHLIA